MVPHCPAACTGRGLTAWDSGWKYDERRAWGGLQARFTNAFLWRTMNTLMEQAWNAFKRDRFLYRPGAPVQRNVIIMTDYWLVERAVVEYVQHLVACGALSPLLRRRACERHSLPSNTYQEAKVSFAVCAGPGIANAVYGACRPPSQAQLLVDFAAGTPRTLQGRRRAPADAKASTGDAAQARLSTQPGATPRASGVLTV